VTALAIDHVLLAAPDLDAAARVLAERWGLRSVAGGRHPGFGTHNRIVPLGAAYLELVAVADSAAAAASPFGRWVAAAKAGRPMGWAVRTGALDVVAARLGLAAQPGSRVAADGTVLTWRTAGIERAAAEPALPFFIEWGAGTPFPGAAGPGAGIARVLLSGDEGRLRDWLGGVALPVEVAPGRPGVRAVVPAGLDMQPIGCL
jgi:Glyoxalase-like domain